MSIISKYNNGKKFTFTTPENFEYINLIQLANKYGIDKTHQVNALYINTKSRYGDSPVAVTGTHIVNLPAHLTDTVKKMIKDEELVDLANEHRLGFTIYSYDSENGKGYSINWVEA